MRRYPPDAKISLGPRSQISALERSPFGGFPHRSTDLRGDNQSQSAYTQSQSPERSIRGTRPRSVGDLSQASINSSVHQLNEQFQTLTTLRAKGTYLRSKLQKSKKHWRSSLNAYRQTQTAYENAIDPSKKDVYASSPDVTRLRALLEVDRDYLESQSIEITKSKQLLDVVQQDISRNETLFMNAARQQSMHTALVQEPGVANSSTIASQARKAMGLASPSAPKIDERLTQYYQKVAEVSNFGERLANHKFDYTNALEARQVRLDRGKRVNLSDDAFEARYQEKEVAITQDLDRVIQEADRLKEECRAAGLDVEGHKSNVPFAEDGPYSLEQAEQDAHRQAFEATMAAIPQEAFENAERVQDADFQEWTSETGSDNFVDLAPNGQHINNWMSSVPV